MMFITQFSPLPSMFKISSRTSLHPHPKKLTEAFFFWIPEDKIALLKFTLLKPNLCLVLYFPKISFSRKEA